MGRYIGPKSKIARKFGEAIFGADRVLEKRNFPPGQHGLARKRKKSIGVRPAAQREAEGEGYVRSSGETVLPYV